MYVDSFCFVVCSVDLFGDCWVLLVICDVFDGVSCFGDFQCSFGVVCNIFSDCLCRLVEVGVL